MNTVELTTVQPENGASSESRVSTWRDSLGIVASVGCAIHCAAMPFVIAYLPLMGLSFLADEAFHKWMALICFLIAIVAFVPGVRKHGNWMPVSIAAVGLTLITFAAFGLAGECCASCSTTTTPVVDAPKSTLACCECACCASKESQSLAVAETPAVEASPNAEGDKGLLTTLAPWITPIGGLILVAAHLWNRQLGCRCDCCEIEPALQS